MEVAAALIFGLVIGSFLNVVILRLPQVISISRPRSHCPQCKRLIPWYDNVPILSYVILRGHCRRCGKKISARYPLIEALSGVVSVLLYFKFGWNVEWAIYLAFSAAMIVLAFIDFDHRILPDPITLNGIWLGVLASVYLAQPSPLVARLLLQRFNLTQGIAGAAVAVGGLLLLRWQPARVASLWLGLAAVVVAAVGGWLWR